MDRFTDDNYSGGTFGLMADNFDEQTPANFYFDDLTVGTPTV